MRPYHGKILTKPLPAEEPKSPAGLILTTMEDTSRTRKGKVLEVASDVHGIGVGDTVICSKRVGYDVDEYWIVSFEDVLAVDH